MSDYMKDTNKSAFPLGMNGVVMQEGLSKRELFAAVAMQGMMMLYLPEPTTKGHDKLARSAIAAADALIAELNREANL